MPTPLDDITGGYLKERQSAEITPYDELMKRSNPSKEIEPPDPGKKKFSLSPGKIVDEMLGVVEMGTQAAGGIMDAGREAGELLTSVFDALSVPSVLQITNEQGELDLDLITGKELEERGGQFVAEKMKVKEPRTIVGGLTRGVAQFLTGFLPAMGVMKGIGPTTKAAKFVKAAAAGAVADATVFDPYDDNFSNFVQQHPKLANPVNEFFSASEDDSEAVNRFKKAVEGLGLGILADAFIAAARGIKASRAGKRAAKELAKEKEQIDKLAKVDEPTKPGAAKQDEPATEQAKPVDPATEKVTEQIKPDETPDKDFVQFDEAKKNEPLFQTGSKQADDERALNINLDRLDTEQDVKDLIEGVGKTFSEDINEARRQVITNVETKKLADDLGMTVDDLLSRRKGEAFNAEQAIAARNILVASGENLIELAKKARVGSDVDLMKLRQAMSKHHAIQSQVSGLTAEAGRALQSFRIQAKSAAQQDRLIKEMLEAGEGRSETREFAEMLSQLDNAGQVNQFVKESSRATTREMVFEAWINGLLSSPATHAVNVLSNALVAGWRVGERRVASLISQSVGDQSIQSGEVVANLFGMVQGAKDGMRLAWKALKTGEPSDQLGKVETAKFKAISGESLGLSGTPGRFADYLGHAVRLPSRSLTVGDEFFRAVGYRMELNALAYRQATQEGLEGKALAERMNDIIRNPPENIEMSAIDAKRYQTFTKPLGEGGQALTKALNIFPGARVIVPFIRTPVNIMKFVGERSALAPLSKNVRAEIAAGGARKDMAMAKIATGSMAMMVAADYAMAGQISGNGPTNPEMRRLKMATGWKPYSIKAGDEYISYSRLDPIGATIGIAADITEIIGQVDDATAAELAASVVVAISQNMASKTYLSGLTEAFNVLANESPDPERNFARASRWVERLSGSVVPAGVAHLERTISPELSATQGIIEKIKSRIPGYSKDLPPRRNIFGEIIVLDGGIGPDIMSPIYRSKIKNDPIAEEIVAQKTMLRMPLKTVDGVKLNSKEYDLYIRLYSGENNRFVKQPLKKELMEQFRSDDYRNATDGQEGGKSVIIRAVFSAYRNAAKAALSEKLPRFRQESRAKKQDKATKLGITF